MQNAGLGILEHDGSYPGDECAATNHPGHRGLDDSQWVMWKAITELYQWCRANGIYLNIPDWYFLNGGTKTGMGYRETNWSLPRAYQGRISPDETTVLCITGNGLKTVEALHGRLDLPQPIPAKLSAFQEHIADQAEAVAV